MKPAQKPELSRGVRQGELPHGDFLLRWGNLLQHVAENQNVLVRQMVELMFKAKSAGRHFPDHLVAIRAAMALQILDGRARVFTAAVKIDNDQPAIGL